MFASPSTAQAVPTGSAAGHVLVCGLQDSGRVCHSPVGVTAAYMLNTTSTGSPQAPSPNLAHLDISK